MEPRLCTN